MMCKRLAIGAFLLALPAVSAFSAQPGLSARLGRCHSSSLTRLSMAVAKKDSYKITTLPGDGIGPEIMSAAIVACQVRELPPSKSELPSPFT